MHIHLFSILLCVIILTPLLGHAKQHGTIESVVIGVPMDVLADYRVFMHGRTPLEITQYSGPKSRRDVVEVILVQQALRRGGLDSTKIILKPLPNYARMISELMDGTIILNGTSIWKTDLKEGAHLFVSTPVIANGQFEAGLYTSPRNSNALKARTLEQVQRLSAVSSRDWTPDWTTLTHMDLISLNHVQDWEAMVRMVSSRRVDFLLAPFQQNSQLMLHVNGMKLQPIPGIKLGLEGSRHFAVSARTQVGTKVYKALQRGLRTLTNQGTIERAYRESGFFNSKVQKWHMLNKTP